jgi:protein ImuB
MFAALHLPDFEIIAALRVAPEMRGIPAAVIDSGMDRQDPKAKIPLLGINHAARQSGIHPGWPLSRALIRCPGLQILPQQPEAKTQLLKELTELAESLTPDLEITSEDTVLLDLSRASPQKIALLDDFEIPHAEIWHARAATPDLAHLAVLHEQSQGGLIDLHYFQRLPLDLLASLPGIAGLLPMLRLWGLKTLGDFMNLPRQDLADRLGPAAGHSHDVLHGKTCRLLQLHRPPESLSQCYDFEDGIHLTEPLVFSAKRLLHTLSARVAAKYLAVATLEISLHLESGNPIQRSIRLPEPLVDATELLLPIQTFLESLQIQSPIIGIELDATTTSPNPTQREWFGRQLPNPSRWADTLARLEALLGRGKIGIPVSENTHRPDAFKLIPPLTSSEIIPTHSSVLGALPLHRFRPPKKIAVAHEAQQKFPIPYAILTGPYTGEIFEKRGPFVSSGDWWENEKIWHHIEWDIQLIDHKILRLAFSPPDHWQLEGIYS